jgi:hypothetical protein
MDPIAASVEAENDLASIWYQLAAQAIDIGLAGAASNVP